MTKKLLIDAHQPEETRVVMLNGNKIEEFDYESTSRRQLKGNVYLARVTRVEPSLQAAFVEYGGNRQGFLAFSEIHPDYYRIPVEDREALEAEQAAQQSDEDDAENGEGDGVDTLGGDDEAPPRRQNQQALRHYKIQEVITRKQIMLVQVVKEERGNKGAALTTYLSLAGRYCVLMPNSNRGGGVSRKITHATDRKRLKSIVSDLDIPKGMAVIVRTAGAKRTKPEIKRDFAYLTKLWDEIRGRTLESEAPCLIHEEGSLVKRAIRDIYTNDIDEVLIEGEESYKIAKAQMKMLIPSHAKRVVKYEGSGHLFQAQQVEPQLDNIYHNEVVLKSGGYLVINQTEALVAIDVNSGKATRERNIEETALKTNLEAADEVGRQLRLRDLSGLIVIDFIDMDENRNQQTVERRLKDALRHDRARIQVGSISHFGLLEMSRQRLRPSLVESVSQPCPHCVGTGRVRSVNASALQMLRVIEDEAARGGGRDINLSCHGEVALYILNEKRASIAWLEQQYDCTIIINADNELTPPDYRLNGEGRKSEDGPRQNRRNRRAEKSTGTAQPQAEETVAEKHDDEDEDQPKKRRRGRRGGRRRKKRTGEEQAAGEQESQTNQNEADASGPDGPADSPADGPADGETQQAADTDKPDRKRRRRGGRGRGAAKSDQPAEAAPDIIEATPEATKEATSSDQASEPVAETGTETETGTAAEAQPKKAASAAKAKKAAKKSAAKAKKKAEDSNPAAPKAKKKARKAAKKSTADSTAAEAETKASPVVSDARAPRASAELAVVNLDEAGSAPAGKKKGWWSR
jgi:ribonuclease E